MKKGRAKFGVIVPSCNTMLEPELYQMVHGHNISFHTTRIKMTEDAKEQIERLIRDVPKAAALLKDADVDVIAFGCTAGSFIKGPNYDKKIITLIEENAQVPATTASFSVVNALKELKLSKISVVTPYEPWLNEKLTSYLGSHGIEVVAIRGLGITKNVSAIASEEILKLVEKVNALDSHGFFISCTDLRSVEMIDIIERKFGKPVVTSNQALLWHMLKTLNLNVNITGYGKLLKSASH